MGALTEVANKRQKVNETNQNKLSVPITEAQKVAHRKEQIMNEAAGYFDQALAEKYPGLAKQFQKGSDKEKTIAANTAIACARTEAFIESARQNYGEATVTQAFGSLNRKLMDVVRIFYPNQVINSVADVQMLDRQNGEIFVIRPKFSNTAAGVTKGQEVFATQTDGTYSGEETVETLGTGNASTTTFTDTAVDFPIRPSSVIIYKDAVQVAKDDGNGIITGSGVSGTINYTTGALSVTFTVAPANAAALTWQYDVDSEQDTDRIRSVEFGLDLIPVKAKQHPLKVEWSVQAELAAAAHLDIDVPDTLTNLAAALVRTERDSNVIRKINKAAAVDSLLAFNASLGSAQYTAQQKYGEIELKIDAAEGAIYNRLGRSGISYVLCGINASQVFRNCPTFRDSPNQSPIGATVIGTLRDGTIDVIRSRDMGTNDYVVGFKGMMAGDSSVIFAEWIPIYFTPIFEAPVLKNSRGVASFYDLFINNKDYFAKGSISNFAA